MQGEKEEKRTNKNMKNTKKQTKDGEREKARGRENATVEAGRRRSVGWKRDYLL